MPGNLAGMSPAILLFHPSRIDSGIDTPQNTLNVMAVAAGWDWDRISGPYWERPAQEVYYLLYHWKATNRLSVLDLGAGIGRHSLLFAEHGFKVTAVDSSESGIRRLREVARDLKLGVDTILANVVDLPFDSGSFDAVLAYHSIYHVDTQGMASAVSELRRVLQPGGEIFLTFISKSTFSYTDPACRFVDENVRMKEEEDGSVLPHYFCDAEEIRKLLSAFDIVSLKQVQDIYGGGKSSWHYFVHARLASAGPAAT